MFMLSCQRLVVTIIMIQISTQSYVFGRPSPPALYDFATTTAFPDVVEPFPTGVIPGLTPEESHDVMEKILQGELQPVMKTSDVSFEPIELREVPSSTDRQNTDFMDASDFGEETAFYFEPPQLSDQPRVLETVPEQEFSTVKSHYQGNPSLYQSTNGGAGASPEGYTLNEEGYPLNEESLEKRMEPVAAVTSVSQPKDNGVPVHSQELPLYSTQNLPEVGETVFVRNNLTHPANILPTNELVEEKVVMPDSITLNPNHNENSFASHNQPVNSNQNIREFSETVNTGVAFDSVNPESTLPKALTEILDREIVPKKSSADSSLPEDPGKNSSVSLEVQGSSPQVVRQLSKSSDSSAPQDLSNNPNQNVQTLPESVGSDFEDHPTNTEATLQIVSIDESVPARQITPAKDSESFNFLKYGKDSPLRKITEGHEKPLKAVPVSAGTDSPSFIDDKPMYPKHIETTDDLVLDKRLTDLQPDHPSGEDKAIPDIPEHKGAARENYVNNVNGSVSALRPVLAEDKKVLAVRPAGVQRNNINVLSAVPKMKVQTTQDIKDTHEKSYPSFKTFKSSSLLDPRKFPHLASKPSMNVGKTLLQKRIEAPSEVSNKKVENVTVDPIIDAQRAQALAVNRINDVGQKTSTDMDKTTITKKNFDKFRTVDMDLLALSDILDSRQDSKSEELPWSAEDSEDDEFWKKMKRFIEFENAQPDERDEIQLDTTTPSVTLAGNINAIPSAETEPTETPVVHVMKIPKSRPDNPSGKEREEYYRELENVTDRNFQTSDDFPVQEKSSALFPTNEELATTEITTPEASLTYDVDRTYVDVGEYNLNNFATTEGTLSYTIPLTEWQEYKNEPNYLESDTAKNERINLENDRNSQTARGDAANLKVAAIPEKEFDKSAKYMKNENFPKEQPKRTTRDNILPSRRKLLSGSVGGSDNVPELKSDTVLPQDDLRFSEGITENFTTDEPLLADVDTYLEYPIKSPALEYRQEKELTEPTDLNSIEADNPMPSINNLNHFVSKKDDPMNTVTDVQGDGLQGVQKSNKGRLDTLSKAPKKDVYPPTVDAFSRKRVRRSDEKTKNRLEEHSLNDIKTSTQPIASITSPRPASSVSHPMSSISPFLLTAPFPVTTSESLKNSSTMSVIQFPSTTPVTPDPSTSPEIPTFSPKSTTLTWSTTAATPAPLTARVNTATTSKVTVSVPQTTSTTLDPPTTYEMLPTPVPDTSTTVNPLISTLTPTSSTAPKKKKKKMVWKIPFYPNNIAITSTGDVRLEPKDKSAKLQTTTTPKPLLLRDRLKPEDLQAARERLYKRFQTRRPSVPLSNTSGAESIKYQTGQPMISTPNITNQNLTGVLSSRPKVSEDVLAYVTAENPSQLPSLLYNSPEEREEARRRRLRNMVGLAGDVRSLLSDRARSAVHTVRNIVGGEDQRKDRQ